MQYVAMFLHVAGFLATVVVLWAIGPTVSAEEALLNFSNLGGWSSTGLALMVGQLTVVFALGGSDAAAHISEEVKYSGLTVPRAIFWTIILNGAMGLIATVSFIFALPSVEKAINDPSGFSMIYVFRLCGGDAAAIGLVLIQLILITFGNISYQAATSRQSFAVGLIKEHIPVLSC
jgi:amino acid transporter